MKSVRIGLIGSGGISGAHISALAGMDDVIIAALADVDYVVVFDDDTPLSLIEAIRPDVLAKGQDWEGREVVGADVVEKGGGKVLFVPFEQGRSTTNIVDRIRGAGASESATKQA